MLDGFHVLTLTHRHVSLSDIGKAMVPEDNAEQVLQQIKNKFDWDELLYLSTCNRVVYVFYSQQPQPDLRNELLSLLHPEWDDAERAALAENMAVLHGTNAVRHIMEVASSMDSLVVGEREIIRQLRMAFERSREMGLTGDHMRLLMRYTIETAKFIYTETAIGEKALSVVALAFQALQQHKLPLNARILMVGAGQTNALFAKFLSKYGYNNISVFNRSMPGAEAIADYLGGQAFDLSQLKSYSKGFDALVVCTGSTEYLITKEVYQQLLAGEEGPKVAVDLSVPNNIDPTLSDNYPLSIIDIEGLRHKAKENMTHRERERKKAAALIEQRLYGFREVWHERQVERSLSNIPEDIRFYKERALNEVFGRELAELDEESRDLIHRMMDYMERKAVAVPMKTMKAIAINRRAKHAKQPTS